MPPARQDALEAALAEFLTTIPALTTKTTDRKLRSIWEKIKEAASRLSPPSDPPQPGYEYFPIRTRRRLGQDGFYAFLDFLGNRASKPKRLQNPRTLVSRVSTAAGYPPSCSCVIAFYFGPNIAASNGALKHCLELLRQKEYERIHDTPGKKVLAGTVDS